MPRGRIVIAILAGLASAGCGVRAPQGQGHSSASTTTAAANTLPRAHPQAIQPVAGAAAAASQPATDQAGVSVGPPSPSLPQPVTEAQVRQELARSGLRANTSQATLTPGGLAVAPIDAPPEVQAIIAAGNEIARLPYRYGGGHTTYEDTAYDCSGSISYVFAAAGLLNQTVTSGRLAGYGQAGAGKWITIFANAGHTFMFVAGLRFDTVALAETGSRWSDRRPDENLSAFSVRHPIGL